MRESGQYQDESPQKEEKVEEVKEDQSETLLEDIRLLNETLAMTGQFSIPMPVTLLLNMIHHDGNILSKENMFLNKLLANDSLVDYIRDEEGYPFVRFRHPREAELYVEKNFGGDLNKRREQEVGLLCKLIAACHWNEDEAHDVISLIRCFGPNSEGKYSQDTSRGNYKDYISFLLEIADYLMKYADDNPEATLVYAHFLRETYSDNQQYNLPNSRDYLGEAKNKLRIAIEQHDQQNLQQYNRLVVEVCSNLVASMPRRSSDGPFDRDVFREFQNTFKLAIKTWDSHNTNSGREMSHQNTRAVPGGLHGGHLRYGAGVGSDLCARPRRRGPVSLQQGECRSLPRCNGNVTGSKKGFFCENPSCRFALWKDNRFFAAKKKDFDRDAAALLNEGKLHLTGCWSEKTKKTYDATVSLEDDGEKTNFRLEFDHGKGNG